MELHKVPSSPKQGINASNLGDLILFEIFSLTCKSVRMYVSRITPWETKL